MIRQPTVIMNRRVGHRRRRSVRRHSEDGGVGALFGGRMLTVCFDPLWLSNPAQKHAYHGINASIGLNINKFHRYWFEIVCR